MLLFAAVSVLLGTYALVVRRSSACPLSPATR